jgi:hypothetical protein
MKLKDLRLYETAATGVTSVASIGKVEFAAFPNRVELYRRNACDKTECIAKIKRHRKDGWRFTPTKAWSQHKLPHFGQLNNIKTPQRGMKTISNNLSNMMKVWGIRYDELLKKSE